MAQARCWWSRAGWGCHAPALWASCTASFYDNLFPCNGTSPATLRCGWRTVSVAPSTKPWSSPNTAPARHTGVVSQHRRPQGKSWPCSGHRPTEVGQNMALLWFQRRHHRRYAAPSTPSTAAARLADCDGVALDISFAPYATRGRAYSGSS